MRGPVVLLATAMIAAPAYGFSPGLTLVRAEKVAATVRHREARNTFHLRKRLGPFTLGHAYCERGATPSRALCHYEAVARGVDSTGTHRSCLIAVRVRLANRVHWRRSVEVCAHRP